MRKLACLVLAAVLGAGPALAKAPEPKKPVKVSFVTGMLRRSVIERETPATSATSLTEGERPCRIIVLAVATIRARVRAAAPLGGVSSVVSTR